MKRALLLLALVACNSDIDEPWQLAHDRIIAVRATPPRIAPGGQSAIDVLLGYKELPTAQRPPDFAQVVSPESLSDVVAPARAAANSDGLVPGPNAAANDPSSSGTRFEWACWLAFTSWIASFCTGFPR